MSDTTTPWFCDLAVRQALSVAGAELLQAAHQRGHAARTVGSGGGAALGAVLGSFRGVYGAVLGAAVGALVGHHLGRSQESSGHARSGATA